MVFISIVLFLCANLANASTVHSGAIVRALSADDIFAHAVKIHSAVVQFDSDILSSYRGGTPHTMSMVEALDAAEIYYDLYAELFEEYSFPSMSYLSFAPPTPSNMFGGAVAINNRYALVGAPAYDRFTGTIQVFKPISESQWLQMEVIPSPPYAGMQSNFGHSMSIDEYSDKLIVGAIGADGFHGRVFIYHMQLEVFWNLKHTISSPLRLTDEKGHGFGHAVGIYKNYAIVSTAHNEAYIYYADEQESFLHTELIAPENAIRFGASVAITKDFAVVGASQYDLSEGIVYTYKYDAEEDSWNFYQQINSVTGMNSYFGHAVDIDMNSIVVGAPGWRASFYPTNRGQDFIDNTGWAYVYQLISTRVPYNETALMKEAREQNITFQKPDVFYDQEFNQNFTVEKLWTLTTELQSPVGYGSWYGNTVAIKDSGSLVVGSPGFPAHLRRGAAFLYHRKFKTTEEGIEDGLSLLEGENRKRRLLNTKERILQASSNETLFLGHSNLSEWRLNKTFPAPFGEGEDFGNAVDVSDNYVVIGSYGFDNFRGAVAFAQRDLLPPTPAPTSFPTSTPSITPTSAPSSRPTSAGGQLNIGEQSQSNQDEFPLGIIVALMLGGLVLAAGGGVIVYCCCFAAVAAPMGKKKKKKKKDGEDGEEDEDENSPYTVHSYAGYSEIDEYSYAFDRNNRNNRNNNGPASRYTDSSIDKDEKDKKKDIEYMDADGIRKMFPYKVYGYRGYHEEGSEGGSSNYTADTKEKSLEKKSKSSLPSIHEQSFYSRSSLVSDAQSRYRDLLHHSGSVGSRSTYSTDDASYSSGSSFDSRSQSSYSQSTTSSAVQRKNLVAEARSRYEKLRDGVSGSSVSSSSQENSGYTGRSTRSSLIDKAKERYTQLRPNQGAAGGHSSDTPSDNTSSLSYVKEARARYNKFKARGTGGRRNVRSSSSSSLNVSDSISGDKEVDDNPFISDMMKEAMQRYIHTNIEENIMGVNPMLQAQLTKNGKALKPTISYWDRNANIPLAAREKFDDDSTSPTGPIPASLPTLPKKPTDKLKPTISYWDRNANKPLHQRERIVEETEEALAAEQLEEKPVMSDMMAAAMLRYVQAKAGNEGGAEVEETGSVVTTDTGSSHGSSLVDVAKSRYSSFIDSQAQVEDAGKSNVLKNVPSDGSISVDGSVGSAAGANNRLKGLHQRKQGLPHLASTDSVASDVSDMSSMVDAAKNRYTLIRLANSKANDKSIKRTAPFRMDGTLDSAITLGTVEAARLKYASFRQDSLASMGDDSAVSGVSEKSSIVSAAKARYAAMKEQERLANRVDKRPMMVPSGSSHIPFPFATNGPIAGGGALEAARARYAALSQSRSKSSNSQDSSDLSVSNDSTDSSKRRNLIEAARARYSHIRGDNSVALAESGSSGNSKESFQGSQSTRLDEAKARYAKYKSASAGEDKTPLKNVLSPNAATPLSQSTPLSNASDDFAMPNDVLQSVRKNEVKPKGLHSINENENNRSMFFMDMLQQEDDGSVMSGLIDQRVSDDDDETVETKKSNGSAEEAMRRFQLYKEKAQQETLKRQEEEEQMRKKLHQQQRQSIDFDQMNLSETVPPSGTAVHARSSSDVSYAKFAKLKTKVEQQKSSENLKKLSKQESDNVPRQSASTLKAMERVRQRRENVVDEGLKDSEDLKKRSRAEGAGTF